MILFFIIYFEICNLILYQIISCDIMNSTLISNLKIIIIIYK